MSWFARSLVALPTLLTVGCHPQEPAPLPADVVHLAASAKLRGRELELNINRDESAQPLRMEALEQMGYLSAGEKTKTLTVQSEKLEPGAKTIDLKAGETIQSVALEAPIAWAPKQGAGAAYGHPITMTCPELGEDIVVPAHELRAGGVRLLNLRSGSVSGRALEVKEHEAPLVPSFLELANDDRIEDLMPTAKELKDPKLVVERAFTIEAVGWDGVAVKRQCKLKATREGLASSISDELRDLAAGRMSPANRPGGAGIFITSAEVTNGRIIGSNTFGKLGYVAWLEGDPDSRKRAGECLYVGRSIELLTESAILTVRRLDGGQEIGKRTIDVKSRGSCPREVYATPDTILVTRPQPSDAVSIAKQIVAHAREPSAPAAL
jgi:hypothetical protein